MSDKTEESRKVLDELERKLAATRLAAGKNSDEAKALSFDAHTGDADAKKRLDALNSKSAAAEREAAQLETAIAEARRRLQVAEADAKAAAEAENARAALGLIDDFERRGDALEKRLQGFLDEFDALSQDFKALEKLGFPPASYDLVRLNMVAAAKSKLMFTPMQVEFLAPGDRRNFCAVIEAWASNVRARATAKLGKSAAAA